MYLEKRILALIPARGGSKGIPDKNIRCMVDKPLVAFSIEAALASSYIDDVVVTTDSERIAAVARKYGARVPFLRPAELAQDDSKTIDCVLHARDMLQSRGEQYDIIVLLQPTSPLRSVCDIDGAIEFFECHGEEGLVSVSPAEEKPALLRYFTEDGCTLERILERGSTIRRQDMRPCYRVDGCIYINRASELSPESSLNDNRIGYVISAEHAVDIDSMFDFERATNLYEKCLEA